MVAMRSARKSIHTPEHTLLRNWLISTRNKRGFSQRDLADVLGVVHSYVGKVESGDRRLDIIEFLEYCGALGVDPRDFIVQFNASFPASFKN